MATLLVTLARRAEITKSFLCPATRTPGGYKLVNAIRCARTVSLCFAKMGTVVIAALGGMGDGASFTAAAE